MHLYFIPIYSLIIFHCIDIPCLSIRVLIDIFFHFLSVMNYAAINICVQVFCGNICFLLNIIPRSGIAGSSGNSLFKHLRNNQTLFQSGCTIFCSLWWCMQILISPILTNTCSYLSFFLAILGDVVLECISLMTNDFEYILICALFVHLLWRNVCSDTLPIFKLDYLCAIALLGFVYSRFKLLIRYVAGKYFLPFHDLSLHLTLLYLLV